MKKQAIQPLKIDSALMEQFRLALEEDFGLGDITTLSIFSEPIRGGAGILAKQDGILCGVPVARRLAKLVDPRLRLKVLIDDGARVKKGDWVLTVRGDVRSILRLERVCLNFIQRLSGVATLTDKYVQQTKGCKARIFDTRKTNPGWRVLDRYAVRVGGGMNHRFGMWDAVMIKNNHADMAGGVAAALRACRKNRKKNIPIIVEARDLLEVREAVDGGAEIVMLDNMNTAMIKRAIALVPKNIEIEVTGGITPRRVRSLAKLGVDRISVGALTHSATAMDFSLRIKTHQQLKEIEAR